MKRAGKPTDPAKTGAATNKIEPLSTEFDALLARMQTPKARRGMRAAFNASPKELAEAASAAARKRG
jgi:antitoxin Phd